MALVRGDVGSEAPAPGPAPILEVEDLEVVYRVYGAAPMRALKGVSLRIAPGEVLGLVGESGAGKSTLSRAIMRALPGPGRVERGRISFLGSDLVGVPDEDILARRGRDLSLIVANPRGELNPLIQIGKQIANVARAHLGVTPARARELAFDMLKAVAIPDPERRMRAYPHELSGGMAQRVVIAIALVCSPKFVISDDATSGLDVTVQAQILELLRTLMREHGASMLYITRDIGVAANFCDRVAIMYQGEIVEEAPTRDFFAGPQHPYSNLLFAAFAHDPSLRERWGAMAGAAPAAGGAPPACLYADRCVRREGRCLAEHPELRARAGTRRVRCHFPVER